jgi:hypothetical protein
VASQNRERPSAFGSLRKVTRTDAAASFRIDALPSGDYRVSIALSGFETFVESVTLETGTTEVLDVELALLPITQRVDVIAVSPGGDGSLSRRRVAASVTVMEGSELEERRTPTVADALNERLGPVSLEEATTNPLQPTLRFRGFTASPLLGLPQGLAV